MMSHITNDKALDKAVELIKHADELTHKWATHLITIQTALITLEGGILSWRADSPPSAIYLASILVSWLGISVAFALSNIVIREHEHGHAYIAMAKRSESIEPLLFRDEDRPVSGPKFKSVISSFKWMLASAWALVMVFSICHVWGLAIHV